MLRKIFGRFAADAGNAAYQNIDVTTFKELKKEHPHAVILDVRTPAEYAQGHIKGSRNLNLFDSKFGTAVSDWDKEKVYLLYCRSGNRSSQACKLMAKQGFDKLYNLRGGYGAWQQG